MGEKDGVLSLLAWSGDIAALQRDSTCAQTIKVMRAINQVAFVASAVNPSNVVNRNLCHSTVWNEGIIQYY